jgi:proline iminopeptidase
MLKAVVALAAFAVASAHAEQARHDIVVDGIRITYWTSRDIKPTDTPVVFLHGGPGYNSYSFRRTEGLLLEGDAPMVYMDERGSGASERPISKDYSLGAMAADVEGVRKALGVDRIIPMGHSFGGAVAATYATTYTAHVDRLILADAAIDMPAAMGVWMDALKVSQPEVWKAGQASDSGRALAATDPKDRCALSKARFAFVMDAAEKLPDPTVFYTMQQFRKPEGKVEQKRIDAEGGFRSSGDVAAAVFGPKSDFICYRADPAALPMPVLVIVGKYDFSVGAAPLKTFAKELKNGRFVELDESAHFSYQEQPQAFTSAVKGFLQQR